MPHYIDTQTLMALSESELRALYAALYAEYQALPAGSEAAAATSELLMRITNLLNRKRRQNYPTRPTFRP